MKPRRFLFITVFLALVFAGFTMPAIAKKKPRIKKPTLAQEIFNKYPALMGSKAALEEQNRAADKGKLPRLEDIADLKRYVENGYLVSVPNKGKGFYLDKKSFKDRGYGDRRYLSPAAKEYLESRAAAYSKSGHPRLKVTSLVRTQDYQIYLLIKRRNPNAAAGEVPEHRSPHLTGHAFDVSTKGLSRRQISWLAERLAEDIERKIILATYEPNGKDFHIVVIPK